ncbi:Snf2 family helicase [Enterococcus villorum]|uniref:Snf2 family helicase n=1 Tax=Enterococcus villorum TaxID=112904 RepID=A0A1V8YV27_9ENTE|nr:DEAD/DEAH box helicase [Enterococcus villorum]OQO70660.1 Snf2 family helicase [Enterococcus villorum]OQO76492.1 Snf2 family helicase [Enterococcus villorum]
MKWSIPEKVIARGRQYLQEGRVLSVVPDQEEKVWHAEVLGSELYMVDLDGTAKEVDFCQCPYWEEHKYCKHTVAVELYLRSKNLSRILKADQTIVEPIKRSSEGEILTKGFSRLKEKSTSQLLQPLIIEYQVETIETNHYHPELATLAVYLRIGYLENPKKTYIVKNIFDFLHAYTENERYTINKQYQFHLDKRAFQGEDQAILTNLAGCAQTQILLGANGLQVKGKLDKRYLLLPIEQAKQLLEQMNQTTRLQMKMEEFNYQAIHFSKNEKPLAFEVTKKDDAYQLKTIRDFELFFTHYQWGMIQGTFFSLTKYQQAIYLTWKQLMRRFEEPEILFMKQELSSLFKEILPLLSEIGDVNVSEDVKAEVADVPVEFVFFFRKAKGKIQARIDFVYQDVIFSTDEKHEVIPENSSEILRDKAQEQRVLDLYKMYHYRKNETGYERVLPKGEELYAFFRTELAVFRQFGEVRLGKKLRELYLDAHRHQPKIEVEETNSWLDIRFDVTGIEEQEINQVLQSLLRNDAFYTLENGQVLSFDSEEFQQTSQILQQFRESIRMEAGTIHVPKNQGLIIQDKLSGSEATFGDSYKKMIQDLIQPEQYQATLPTGLQAELRDYQKQGFKWLKMLGNYQFGGILADEMGLGKTLQMIAYLLSEKEEKGELAALIVAPASLIYNWQAEVKKFAPTLSVQVVNGNKKEREELLSRDVDILITSYASLRQDLTDYQKRSINYLILDEAQMVKNSSTKTAQALRELNVPQRFALSGTPIENNLEELWSLFGTIMPGFFPNKTRFRELSPEEIAQMIRPFVLRRDKQTVLNDLPEKTEMNLYSALTEEQKTVYLAYLRQMREEISSMDSESFKKNRISILAGLTRLRQVCCDPRLFLEDYQGGSGKLEQVKDLLVAAKENNRRVLLFSQFTGMLTILQEELAELGLSTFYLRGSTKPQDRLTMVDAFNEGERDVFLISLKAGGTGLNLTGADTVILYDLWWNPAIEEQAAGRAHRIGQKNVVEVWRMIAEGTIEERMDSLQQEKRELFQKVIQGSEEQLTKLTEEDIRMILSAGELEA